MKALIETADAYYTALASSNEFDIPDLAPQDLIGVPLPCAGWGTLPRSTDHHGGSWHFYVDDYKFSNVLLHPRQVVDTDCALACEVNLSLFDDTPMAICYAGIYQKRWLSRIWQALGLQILVDVNVPAKLIESGAWRIGVPDGWTGFSTRGYDQRLEDLDLGYQAARSVAGKTPTFLVVGDGPGVKRWCRGRPGVILGADTFSRQERFRKKPKTLNEIRSLLGVQYQLFDERGK